MSVSTPRRFGRGWPRVFSIAAGQLALLLATLIAAEALLHVAGWVSRDVQRVLGSGYDHPLTPDSRLGSRGNPLTPGHDVSGWRNERRLAHSDIVTLGDSQTYGANVEPAEAWPQVLSRISGRSVYNMALPTYGPVHSLLLLDEALALSPQRVIVAPYFGNDLFDCFNLALTHPQLMQSSPERVRLAAEQRERESPLKEEIERRSNLGVQQVPRPQPSKVRVWVSEHVRLYGLARAAKNRLLSVGSSGHDVSSEYAKSVAALSTEERRFASPFDEGGWRTILTVPYRFLALDDRDPRIRLGFEVCRGALLSIDKRVRETHGRLLVALIPTKERVVWHRVANADRYSGLPLLVSTEDRLRKELIETLEAEGIAYLDLLQPLQASTPQPYFEDTDGHPNPAGHRAIAVAISAYLQRQPAR